MYGTQKCFDGYADQHFLTGFLRTSLREKARPKESAFNGLRRDTRNKFNLFTMTF